MEKSERERVYHTLIGFYAQSESIPEWIAEGLRRDNNPVITAESLMRQPVIDDDDFMTRAGAWLDARLQVGLAEARQGQLRHRCILRNIPPNKRPFILNPSLLRETQALAQVRTFMANQDTFLLITGLQGRGKTLAAAWAVGTWPDSQLARPKFITAEELGGLSEFDGGDDTLMMVRQSEFLAVDDIGIEYLDDKGFRRARFEALIDLRYRNEKKTILTTNVEIDVILNRYGSRFIARISECGSVVDVSEDPSLRV